MTGDRPKRQSADRRAKAAVAGKQSPISPVISEHERLTATQPAEESTHGSAETGRDTRQQFGAALDKWQISVGGGLHLLDGLRQSWLRAGINPGALFSPEPLGKE